MKAVLLESPGPPEALKVRDVPLPVSKEGWVRIRVEAFGINRSEYHLRKGLSQGVSFPRVPGIECAGIVDSAPGSLNLKAGQQVVAMMGNMGRTYDGGYAEFTCVPSSQVIPIHSKLPWEMIGAAPEMLQTAYGSLTIGLDLKSGQTLLIRGGTTSVGLAAAAIAKLLFNATVIATSRKPERLPELKARGIDHPLLDSGEISAEVIKLCPGGVDAALELVGVPTLKDTLSSTRVHGTVCMSGIVSDQWTISEFYPIGFIPKGVRLTAYGGDAGDLPADVLQRFLDAAEAGKFTIPIFKVFHGLEQAAEAHRLMETNQALGKMVVRVLHPGADSLLK